MDEGFPAAGRTGDGVLLDIAGLSVAYRAGKDSLALNGIDLSISRGERVAVIGESGSGKSTLALAIAGLLPRDAAVQGRLNWHGLALAPRNGKDIGFIFQDAGASLDPVMTIGRQVAEVAEIHLGLERHAALERTVALFERVGLPEPRSLLDAYVHQLSGGQKQRVGIAAAIVAEPILLIADEPTSALDSIVQAEIVRLIEGLVSARGMALLLVSHDIALAAALSDRVVVMKDGRTVETGVTVGVLAAPRAAYTRALLAASLSLDDAVTTGGTP